MKIASSVLVLALGAGLFACSSDGGAAGDAGASTPITTTTPDAGGPSAITNDAGPTGPVACASPPCADGDACVASNDCASKDCVANRCIPISCTDGLKNADETDTDCGGSCAKKCTTAQACRLPADCADGVCTAATCVAPTSGDGVKNGNESALDCGSSTAGGADTKALACAAGLTCTTDADCLSGGCNHAGVCAFARSCIAEHGGTTCGAGDYTSATKSHEDCCTSAQVDNYTSQNGYSNPLGKAYRLDKYQITTARIRTFLDAVGGNVQKWVQTNRAKIDAPAQLSSEIDPYLPKAWVQADSTDNCTPEDGSPSIKCNYGALSQVSGYRYNSGPGGNGGYGCYMAKDDYGTRSFNLTDAELKALNDGEIQHLVPTERLAEKAATCITYPILAAFCAWDGGHLESLDEYDGAFGGRGGVGAGRRYPYIDGSTYPDPTRSIGFGDLYADNVWPTDNYGAAPPAPTNGEDPFSVYNDKLSTVQSALLLLRLQRANHASNYFNTIILDYYAPLEARTTKPVAAEANIDVANDSSVLVAPPGRYPLGAGKYGHRDLVGNILEITSTISNGTGKYTPTAQLRWTNNGSFDYANHFDGSNMIGYDWYKDFFTKYGRAGGRCARPVGVYPATALPKTN